MDNQHPSPILLGRFNDYPEREYIQADGSGEWPNFEKKVNDIV